MLTNITNTKPRILCLSGLDPTGGAGIQADIETLLMHHCHCLPLVTLNSIQDSKGVYQLIPTNSELLWQQFEKLKDDGEISAIKIGMLANTEQVGIVSNIIKYLIDIPVVLDPVFSSGLGTPLARKDQIRAMREQLLGLCSLVTPNTLEAKQLHVDDSAKEELDNDFSKYAQSILETGTKHVLITGTHAQRLHNKNNEEVINHHLYSNSQQQTFQVKRLAGSFHGSGCTLASAICANLANRQEMGEAIENALAFTQQSLVNAQALGKYQLFPTRWQFEHGAE